MSERMTPRILVFVAFISVLIAASVWLVATNPNPTVAEQATSSDTEPTRREIKHPHLGTLSIQDNLALLRAELDNDPKGLGYAGKTNQQQANLINEIGLSGEIIDVLHIEPAIMQAAVEPTEYNTLPPTRRELWLNLLLAFPVEISQQSIRDQIDFVWNGKPVTNANLVALQTRSGSRCEVLFGDGVVATSKNIDEALLLP